MIDRERITTLAARPEDAFRDRSGRVVPAL
jgi:hypothetical protein